MYEITPERLILKRGIVMKSIDEIELYRIKDIRMDFSLLNQWAGIGTICLTSSDETTRTGELLLRNVPKAQMRREELRHLVDAAAASGVACARWICFATRLELIGFT